MRTSRFDQCGYVMVDDRASGGAKIEKDVLGCGHCHGLVDKIQWKSSGAYCPTCDGALCLDCAKSYRTTGCVPHVKWFTDLINDLHRKEQNSKLLGI